MTNIDDLIARLEAAEKDRDEACAHIDLVTSPSGQAGLDAQLKREARAFLARMEAGRGELSRAKAERDEACGLLRGAMEDITNLVNSRGSEVECGADEFCSGIASFLARMEAVR